MKKIGIKVSEAKIGIETNTPRLINQENYFGWSERMKAWEGCIDPVVKDRTEKPRKSGVTMLLDKG